MERTVGSAVERLITSQLVEIFPKRTPCWKLRIATDAKTPQATAVTQAAMGRWIAFANPIREMAKADMIDAAPRNKNRFTALGRHFRWSATLCITPSSPRLAAATIRNA